MISRKGKFPEKRALKMFIRIGYKEQVGVEVAGSNICRGTVSIDWRFSTVPPANTRTVLRSRLQHPSSQSLTIYSSLSSSSLPPGALSPG
jgi:hypothetical protein